MKFDVQAFINHPRVRTRRKDGLVLFNYDMFCVFDRLWDEITTQSRGLILDEATGEVVARPWPKFWNLNEMPQTCFENLPNLPFEATDKVDGSLGIHYRWKGEDFIATRGAFESTMAVWGTSWFRKNVNASAMDPEWTYLFEIIYKENKIVISYDFEGLVLLGAVNKETGADMPHDRLVREAEAIGTRVVGMLPTFPTLLDLAEYVKNLPGNKEGCVVTFSNGLKVKMKGSEYCRLHKIVCRMTPLAFWEVYDHATGKIPLDYLVSIPEEFRDLSNALVKAIEGSIETALVKVGVELKCVKDALPPGADQKMVALKAKEMYPESFGWIMTYYRGDLIKLRVALHRKYRPTGNAFQDDIPELNRIKTIQEDL